MTITSAHRNHGNTELINSRTEELLVRAVHAAFLSVRVNLTLGLQRFVCDVLGYINLPASFSPPSLSHHYKSQSCARVCWVYVRECALLRLSVDIFPAFPRERRQGKSEKYSHVLSGDLSSAMFAPLFAFSLTLLQKIPPVSLHPSAFLLLPPVILCALKPNSSLSFVRCRELFKCSPLLLSSALCCELASFAGIGEKVEGFCVSVIANVVFVPACHCSHQPLNLRLLLSGNDEITTLFLALTFPFYFVYFLSRCSRGWAPSTQRGRDER